MTRRASVQPVMPSTTKKHRCAVYTRKSTDEVLEKEFNTLDAQRDACEAYVALQRAEGWLLLRDRVIVLVDVIEALHGQILAADAEAVATT